MPFFFTGQKNNVDRAMKMAKGLEYPVKGTIAQHSIDCTQEEASEIADKCNVKVGVVPKVVKFAAGTYKIVGKRASITNFESHLRKLRTMSFREFEEHNSNFYITISNAEKWEVAKSAAQDYSVKLEFAW